MKVLIITYYWPPAGGSGVQRWLKFVKYLPYYGITPIVFVPKKVNYPVVDNELVSETKGVEVISHPFLDLQKLARTKKKGGDANVSSGGVLSWIRGNLFIPDPKILWVKPSVKYLTKYLKNNDVDLVISTGPPHSVHLIASELKRKFAIKWIADFRDPWTSLYYLNDFKLSKFSRKRNKKLEIEVLNNADTVVTVSNFLKQELSSKTNKPVKVVTNGYDDEFVEEADGLLDEKFSISYIGLLPKQSNSNLLWEVLGELKKEEKQFKNDLEIVLVGNICDEAIFSIKKNQLEENLKVVGYVPHSESVKLQRRAQVLLLLIPKTEGAKGIITGKVFEYLKAKRPILAIGPEDGDLAEILTKTNSGTIVDFSDKEKMKQEIKKLYVKYKAQKLTTISNNIKQYHRKELTSQLATILKQLANS